eukprot:g43872.t1
MGGEYVSDGSIPLEVAKMAADELQDVDAGGMVGKDKGNPIAVAGEKKAEMREMGRALLTTVLGNPWLRKKVDILEAPLLNTAYEGIYLDSYYLDIQTKQPRKIIRHNIPAFIPLEQTARKYLQNDLRQFMDVLRDALNAYASRRYQVEQLQ